MNFSDNLDFAFDLKEYLDQSEKDTNYDFLIIFFASKFICIKISGSLYPNVFFYGSHWVK